MRILHRSSANLVGSRGVALASILLSLSAANCSSDDTSTTNSGGTSGTPAGIAGTSGATGGNGGTSGTPGGIAGTSGATGGSAGAMTAGGSGGEGAVSQACIDFCSCYETKCAGFVSVPGGAPCTTFCETFVDQKMNFECRKSMCEMSGGPQANNNDHCSHSLGIGQCN